MIDDGKVRPAALPAHSPPNRGSRQGRQQLLMQQKKQKDAPLFQCRNCIALLQKGRR